MTRAAPPVWLLDVDGVVNALARGPVEQSWPADQWVQLVVRADIPDAGAMVLPILAARPVLDFVARVVATGAAEVVWHSTWRSAATTELAPALGLPAIPVSDAPEWLQPEPGVWWKLPAARRVLAAGRRLVWTDDDLTIAADLVADLHERPDTLLIGPDRERGLTHADLDTIGRFIGFDAAAPQPVPRRSRRG